MKQLKKLVISSYTNKTLDEKKVARVAKLLSKEQLREYIKALKAFEKQNTVVITLADTNDKKAYKDFAKLFKDKKIIIRQDKSLLAGIKIEDFDNVYEFNLKNKVDNIVNFINQ
ncbi:MAG: hypothetical protein HYT06_00700 [Candidatus Levybacteria bacterium]|nr:hypothetical protein [Candidatus Levybacteria bacterium]